MMPRPSRPAGITILAILEILFGIVGLIASLAIIGLSALVSTLPTVGGLLGAFGLIIGGVFLFFSVVWLATGFGFLHGKGWAWTLGMIFSVLSILGAIGAITIGLYTGGVGGLIFWGLMIYYLTRNHVKIFFGKGAYAMTPKFQTLYSPQTGFGQPMTGDSISYGHPAVAPPTLPFQPATSLSTASQVASISSYPNNSAGTGPNAVVSCAYCGSKLTMGSSKCITCGATLTRKN